MQDPHLQRAQILLQQGRTTLAGRELAAALRQDPENEVAHALIALLLIERKNYKLAKQAANDAIHFDPESPLSYYALGRVEFDFEKYKAARKAFDAMLTLDPTDSDGHYYLAAIAYMKNRPKRALTHLDTALQQDPNHTASSDLRSQVLCTLGRVDDAIDESTRMLAEDAASRSTHTALGWACLRARRTAEAIEHFQAALLQDATDTDAQAGFELARRTKNPIIRLLSRPTHFVQNNTPAQLTHYCCNILIALAIPIGLTRALLFKTSLTPLWITLAIMIPLTLLARFWPK